jgi:hypothetical protein
MVLHTDICRGFRERVFQQSPRRSQEFKVTIIVLQRVVQVEVPGARPIVDAAVLNFQLPPQEVHFSALNKIKTFRSNCEQLLLPHHLCLRLNPRHSTDPAVSPVLSSFSISSSNKVLRAW